VGAPEDRDSPDAAIGPTNAASRLASWVALAAALLFSIAFAATRNVYDDEIASFRLTTLPLIEGWHLANAQDVHPPLQYAAGHVFLRAAGSARLAMLGPIAVLYAGTALFVAALLREEELRGGARTLFAAIGFLHPQMLMWGSSLRWQPLWTGVALAMISLGLELGRGSDTPRRGRAARALALAAVALAATALLYLNYATLVFLVALSVGAAIRFGLRGAAPLLAPLAIAGLAFAPQLDAMWNVHMRATDAQVANLAIVALKLAPGAVVGEALLPWHPLAPIFGLATLPFLAKLVAMAVARVRSGAHAPARGPAWLALLGIYVALVALALATGLGRKPRNFILLGPLFAYLFAFAWQSTRTRALRVGAVALVALWIATSAAHLWLRVGTSKSGFNDHYEEVVAFAASTARGRGAVFFTHDPALAFAIHEHARIRGERWAACSTTPDWLHEVACAERSGVPATIERVFLVDSYVGSYFARRFELAEAINAVGRSLEVERRAELSRDRDAAMKRRLPGALAKLSPDHRFTVFDGRPTAAFELERFARAYLALAPEARLGADDDR